MNRFFVALVLCGLLACFSCLPSFAAADGAPELARWMDLSFVEADDFAGYGPYPPELLVSPALYWTHGAVQILSSLARPIENSRQVGDFVRSLEQTNGMYDDAATDAPVFMETLWALRVLRLLEEPPRSPEAVRNGLLENLRGLALDPAIIDRHLIQQLADAMLIVQGLQQLDGKEAVSSYPESRRVSEAARQVLLEHPLTAADCLLWNTGPAFDAFWLAARLVSAVNPRSMPNHAVECLERCANGIPTASGDFIITAQIANLVEMLGAVQEWTNMPSCTRNDIRDFLTNRVFPSICDIGGYGWRNAWNGGVIDTPANVRLVQLCAQVGVDYPHTQALVAALDLVRVHDGWIPRDLATPSPHMTYYALIMLTDAGLSPPSPTKVASYLRSFFRSPGESLRNLFHAAIGRILLGEERGAVRDEVLASLSASPSIELAEEPEWLTALLFHFQLSVETSAIDSVLTARAIELADYFQQTSDPRMFMLHEMAQLASILQRDIVPRDALLSAILALEAEGGGFLAIDGSPIADTGSTLEAIEALSALQAADAIPAETCRRFVERCSVPPGFSFAPPEELVALNEDVYVDLLTSATAVRLLWHFQQTHT